MQAALVQHAHRRAKAIAFFAAQQGAGGHAAVVEHHVARQGAGLAHLLVGLADAQARGAGFDQEARDRVGTALRRGARHDREQAGDGRVGDVALGAVQHVAVAIAFGGQPQRHRVGAGIGLGQCERADQFAASQLGQVAGALVVRAGQHDGLRTDADVGAGQRTKRGRGLAQFEHHPHFFFHRQAQAAEFRRDRQAEETQFAHFVDDGGRDLAA
ncbi:hypothetical protein G6F22_017597 [Rhizopus arrhizus]|nr:hypothetical protein G6F22_017597 [Rhizopus arrhizus]